MCQAMETQEIVDGALSGIGAAYKPCPFYEARERFLSELPRRFKTPKDMMAEREVYQQAFLAVGELEMHKSALQTALQAGYLERRVSKDELLAPEETGPGANTWQPHRPGNQHGF